MDLKTRTVDYLKNRELKLCTLATASATGKPEVAVLGYAVRDDFVLILSTHKESRKWQNLLENPRAALTVGGTFTDIYLQLEGDVQLITEGEAYEQCDTFFFSWNPQAAKFKSPSTVFIKIIPTWVRLLDYSVHPQKTEEQTYEG